MKALLLALAVVLAGCSDAPDAGTDLAPGTAGTASVTGTAALLANASAPLPSVLPIDWGGELTNGVWLCGMAPVHQCVVQPAGAFGTDLVLEGLSGNITAGQMTMTWASQTPATARLVIEANAFTPDCGDCGFTHLGDATGTSPLTLTLAPHALADGEVVTVAVYKEVTVLTDVVVGDAALAQSFHVEGNVTYLPTAT